MARARAAAPRSASSAVQGPVKGQGPGRCSPWPARKAALARAAEAVEEPPHPPRPTAALEAADEALARELDEQLNRNLRHSALPSRATVGLDPTNGGGGIGGGAQPPGYVRVYGSAADYEDVEWEEGGPPEGRDAAAVAAVLAKDEQHG